MHHFSPTNHGIALRLSLFDFVELKKLAAGQTVNLP